jgi:type III secretion protein U
MAENKNLDPTDHKIDKAREKGQIAQSQDLSRLANLVVVAEIAFITESKWRESVHSLMEFGYSSVGKPFLPAMQELLIAAGLLLLIVFFVGFVVIPVVSMASHWMQFGILVAPEALTPKFDKLNPVNGFKSIFSVKKLVEFFETVIKAILIGLVVFMVNRTEINTIINLAGGTPKDSYAAFLTLLRYTFHIALIICLVFAMIDFAIQKHFHKKELMMDMEELKQEIKEIEGDPLIKNKRKQIAREWANENPVAKTEKANAVVVNPTHFAVAMFYDQEDAQVPVVLAKGKDYIAQAMIDRARECGIPVIRHVWLARTLYATCKTNSFIPKSSYEAVAHVYAVVNYLMTSKDNEREFELESLGEPPDFYSSRQ